MIEACYAADCDHEREAEYILLEENVQFAPEGLDHPASEQRRAYEEFDSRYAPGLATGSAMQINIHHRRFDLASFTIQNIK
jgi:hypothetical protein